MNKLQASTPILGAGKDKSKDWQLEILMEKLRSKASQSKSLVEISKNVRMTMLEKLYALDSVEKAQHQKCLDILQQVIKVNGLQSMIERLESLTRQLGLRCVVEPSGVLFISSDMFYLEIILDSTGGVKDVKIHHEGKIEQQSCIDLVNCLSRGDFADFTTQLEGFVSIYQLNAEKKVKCKAFTALECLEADLNTIAQMNVFIKEHFNLIHKSPVGVLENRKGGHPMKLTYFVSPYDLINVEKYDMDAIHIENIINKGVGYSVTVCMEGSTTHNLQSTTLTTINRNMNGRSSPVYAPITNQNSSIVPACFILKLNKPIPMCMSLLKKIQQIQQLPETETSTPQPLLNLIVEHNSEKKLSCNNNKGLFVTLPDQTHCYCMTENKNMNGIYISSIPFTHPAQVPNILTTLREQALFNTIIESCIRPNSRQNFENMIMFEICALSSTQISISMEHPLDECMATADIDMTDVGNLMCRVQSPGSAQSLNTLDSISEFATKVLNKSFSIPVTLRSVIKMWEKQAVTRNLYSGHENFNLPLGAIDPGGHKNGPGSGPGGGGGGGGSGGGSGGLTDYGGMQDKINPDSNGMQGQGHGGQLLMLQEQQGINYETMMTSNFQNFPSSEAVLSHMELTNILAGSPDKPSNKRHKRKDAEGLWKTGKRKVGSTADDAELMETSSCDSTSRSTPISSHETEFPTPNSNSQSDLELSNMDSLEYLSSIDKTPNQFGPSQSETVDMEEILSGISRDQLRKSNHEQSSNSNSSIVSELNEKNIVPPNVSITPITSSSSPGFATGSSEKRPGIEIIPISQSVTSLIPSSITITPITTARLSDDKTKDKKSSRSSRDDKERKRRKKRDESPMGPPDKVPMKQDALLKSVSVSIKPAESPPLSNSTPTSPSMIRKFSPSPTNRSLSISGKLSPNLIKPNKPGSSHHSPSPKNSPAYIPSSPKHGLTGTSSPKHHGASPSNIGSGKPSMSTLKNAANSPSHKSSTEKIKIKDPSREKEKNRSGMLNTNVSKNKLLSSSSSASSSSSLSSTSSASLTASAVKIKPLELSINNEMICSDGLPSPSADSKANANQLRNRKNTLSAIVDKLKVNASQHSDSPTDLSSKSSSGKLQGKDNGKGNGKIIGDVKNSEYMVKTSSDGMKLTINKPRTKDSKPLGGGTVTAGSAAGGGVIGAGGGLTKGTIGSPKIHTGLKPGVNSGPASKKPQQIQKSNSASNILNSNSSISTGNSAAAVTSFTPTSCSSTLKGSTVTNLIKSISSSGSGGSSSKLLNATNMSSKSAAGISKSTAKVSSTTATDLSRIKDRLKTSKSSSEKSIFSSLKDRNKSSPTSAASSLFSSDADNIYKLPSKMDAFASTLMDVKTLDKNFQIPKLSARVTDEKKKNEMNNLNRTATATDSKIFDMMVKNDIKFPLPPINSLEQKIRNNMSNVLLGSGSSGSSGIKNDDADTEKKKDLSQNLTGADELFYTSDPLNPYPSASEALHNLTLVSKYATSTAPITTPTVAAVAAATLIDSEALDFSKSQQQQQQPPSTVFLPQHSPSPSSILGVHIINSRASSRSSSCPGDEDLIDDGIPIGKQIFP